LHVHQLDLNDNRFGATLLHARYLRMFESCAFMEATMGNNSTQGWAVLILMLAFTSLSVSLFYEGSIVFLVLAVVIMAGAISLFRKAKALEDQR
jgi:hypothetical protein